ncbi:hypothetical protein [Legionella spiritensis]|uniref:Uncharacterized protein n=1 Tax=Legionella spiritensis TaxID=452 RepID=A0A0W0Z5Y8_LEGSP|nr:hypothetical protein [Legionella spiritensis]KTD64529.1 hypothetical protein Lspi_1336 [Legionella spiritensis]SNV29929.1 Uncharacterised protein [Legionella spiritensis]
MKDYKQLRKEFSDLLQQNLWDALNCKALNEQERLKKIKLAQDGVRFLQSIDELRSIYYKQSKVVEQLLEAGVQTLQYPTEDNLGLFSAHAYRVTNVLIERPRVGFFAATNLVADTIAAGVGAGFMFYGLAVLGGLSALALGPFGGLAVALVMLIGGAVITSAAIVEGRNNIRLWRGSQVSDVNDFVAAARDVIVPEVKQEVIMMPQQSEELPPYPVYLGYPVYTGYTS